MVVWQCLQIVYGQLRWGGFVRVSYGSACQLIPLSLHFPTICASSRRSKNCCYTYSLKLRSPLAPSYDFVNTVLCNRTSNMVPLYWMYYVGETLINRAQQVVVLRSAREYELRVRIPN
jgi:hypothetical protein